MRLYPVRMTPRDTTLLVRCLDAVDDVVTSRLRTGSTSPHEEHLTAMLCELLDEKMTTLYALPYPLTKLREELGADPKSLGLSCDFEAVKYPGDIESKVTWADLGIVVIFRDNVEPENSFEKGGLLQAKKLYRQGSRDCYSLDDKFEKFEARQLLGLVKLAKKYSERYYEGRGPCEGSLCFYLLYCPRLDAYKKRSADDLRHYAVPYPDLIYERHA
jgi:hypothetical protein